MKLIIGLGNPGEQYEKTRHNVGFMVLEQFLKDFESAKDTVWQNSKKFKADIAEIEWQPKHGKMEKVILVKPKTYMNNSGMSVDLVAKFYKIQPKDIWVVHDDVDLRLGTLRIRKGGGSAGHRGIESLLTVLPEGDFWRFRCGIGRPDDTGKEHMVNHKGIDDFVLGTFNHEERSHLKELIHHSAKALEMALEEGLESAMNKYNTK
ncbi:MAG TPA: aminoacyl-tRNA hydrolase [Patescibacteria group bacterium]